MVYLKKSLHSLYDFSNSFDYIDTTIEGERYSEEFVLGAKTYNSQIEICCSFSTLIFTLEELLHSTEYRVPPEQQYTCCCTSSSSTLAAVPPAVVEHLLLYHEQRYTCCCTTRSCTLAAVPQGAVH